MRFRFWGGLFLVVLLATLMMTMGCEKGALGLKASTVVGRIVDVDSPTTPVAGARVEMSSQQGSSGNAEKQTGFNYIGVTNAAGQFIFENVAPDQLKMLISATGYSSSEFPPASATVQFFYVGNGVTLNLGDISLARIAQPLTRTTVTVRAIVVDAISKDELPDTKVLSVYIAGEKYQNRDITYSELKNGIAVPAALTTYPITIITSNYKTYKQLSGDPGAINGSVDNVLNIELDPITYNVRVTFRNKPFYMTDQARELNSAGTFAMVDREKCTLTITSSQAQAGKPFKVLATSVVDLDPYEPEAILSGISLPASLTVLVSGYREMTFPVPFTPDTQGLIAMKLNMEPGALTFGVDFDSNKILRPVVVKVNPDGDNIASPPIVLVVTNQVRVRALNQEWGLAPLNSFDAESLSPTIRNLPCGYIIPFEVHARTGVGGGSYYDTTNYVYINPVNVPVGGNTNTVATFTAGLLISPLSHRVRP